MKAKYIWMAIAVAVGGSWVNSYVETRAKNEAARAEKSRAALEVKNYISKVSTHYNAVTLWESALSRGERYRSPPILTIELESLWLGERPILFEGSIKDVSSVGTEAYEIVIERGSLDHMYSTELRLSLFASKALVDSFLQKHPRLLEDYGFNNGVAVIANIQNISATDERDEIGERVEVKTGQGFLLELIYTGNRFR